MRYAEAQYVIDGVLSNMTDDPIVGLVPNDLTNFVVTPSDTKVEITFTPSDTYINGHLVCTMAGVIIRRKVGSAPINEHDGCLVADFNGDSLYAHTSTPYVDSGLVNGQTYFYRAFTYNHTNVVNRSENMIREVVVNIPAPTDITRIWGFHQDFTNLDPNTCITYLEDAAEFEPMMTNSGNGTPTEGSWSNWSWLLQNLPYMVKKDGTADYLLEPNDYTLKLDGTASDVNNPSYEGGAFAWLPKIYMKEVYASDGNSRDVYFALDNTSDVTSDFHIAPGFRDKNNNELDGIWLPMFYANESETNQSYSGVEPVVSRSTEDQLATLSSFSSSAALLGGPIMNTLRDILYLLYRSTNIQDKGGYGNCYGAEILNNAVQHRGRFYGSSDRRSLNKAFHSIVLFSYNVSLADPYTVRAEDLYVKFNTVYNSNGELISANQIYNTSSQNYSSKLAYGGDLIGSVTVQDNSGSSISGLCDTLSSVLSESLRISARLGNYVDDETAGPAMLECNHSITAANAYIGFATIILPAAGYKPAL